MKITFLGATHQVTGSCTLLEWLPGRYCIVDYGMIQGENEFLQQDLPIAPGAVEYVFLTHAHIDHTGRLPFLYKNGFRGKIYCTDETASLCSIMLADSAQIQETDAAYQTKKNLRVGKPAVEPLYTREDAANVMKCFRTCKYQEMVMVDQGLSVRFSDAGHLLGSSFIEFFLEEDGCQKKMVFSGDVGNTNQPIICDPSAIDETDYLLIESTYGTRLHDRQIDPIPLLVEVLRKTFSRGGTVIIPSFAVGRTQEMLYFFREIKQKNLLPEFQDFPVYVDSPLANEATAIFLQCNTVCLDEETRAVMKEGENPIWFDGLHTVVTADESKLLNEDGKRKVVIASGGMCEGGRIRHHLKHGIWNKNNTILFVGFQAAGTLGRKILDGAKEVNILGEMVDVNAELAQLQGVSGHADRNGLLDWVDHFKKKPVRVFIDHGDEESCTAFAAAVAERYQVPAEAPYSGSCFDLLKNEWIRIEAPVRIKPEQEPKKTDEGRIRNVNLFNDLMKVLNDFTEYIKNLQGHSNHELSMMIEKIKDLMK